MSGPEEITKLPCVLCRKCQRCNGQRTETSYYLNGDTSTITCPDCDACLLCEGSGLVAPDRYAEWMAEHPDTK